MANMQMAGFTFGRERIGKIILEIERQKKSARDFAGDTRKIRALAADGQYVVRFEGSEDLYGFTSTGRNQFACGLNIPQQFFNRLADDSRHQGELAHLTNHLLLVEPQSRLVRTLDSKVRAFLSRGYRTLDNADLFFLASDEFQKVGAEIWEARLTENSFRVYAVAQGISAEVRDDVQDGTHWRPEDGGSGKPDRHVAAVCIQNSETGLGALRVRPCTLRMVCANWNVWDESLTQIHIGRKREEQGWISQDTLRIEDRLIWNKVRDIIRTAFDEKRFQEVVARLQAAKGDQVPDPVEVVSAAVEFCGLPEASIEAIRAKFIKDKDFTRYGLVQAVTWQAHDAKADEDRDALDDAGGKILASPLRAILA